LTIAPADLPAVRIPDIADLVIADRRDGIDGHVTRLAGGVTMRRNAGRLGALSGMTRTNPKGSLSITAPLGWGVARTSTSAETGYAHSSGSVLVACIKSLNAFTSKVMAAKKLRSQ